MIQKKLRVLDVSKNKLTNTSIETVRTLASLPLFTSLKTLNLDGNLFYRSTSTNTLQWITELKKLQTLSMNHNQLGVPVPHHVQNQIQQQQQQKGEGAGKGGINQKLSKMTIQKISFLHNSLLYLFV